MSGEESYAPEETDQREHPLCAIVRWGHLVEQELRRAPRIGAAHHHSTGRLPVTQRNAPVDVILAAGLQALRGGRSKSFKPAPGLRQRLLRKAGDGRGQLAAAAGTLQHVANWLPSPSDCPCTLLASQRAAGEQNTKPPTTRLCDAQGSLLQCWELADSNTPR